MSRIRYVVFFQVWLDEYPATEFHSTLSAAQAQLRSMRDAGYDAWVERYNPALQY